MTEHRIVLDRERVLKFSNRSFFEIEKKIGKPVLLAVSDTEKASSLSFLATFLWAGMLHEKVSYDEVVEMIPLNRYTQLIEFMMGVIMEEFGLSQANGNGEKKSMTEATSGTGEVPS